MTTNLVAEKPEAAGAPNHASVGSASEAHENAQGSWGRWVVGLGVLVILVLGGGLVAATLPRLRHQQELNAAATRVADSPPRVRVASVHRSPAASRLTLPGNAFPYRDASLYARTNGYVKHWTVDIGDRVKAGQLLAEISAPDVDDQLAQARANLALAKANLVVSEANLQLANITLERDRQSVPGSGVSLLQIDQDRAQVKSTSAQLESARASIQVNEATVQQYMDLQAFQKIVAPFAGVITSRNVDPGVLVTADNPSETRPIFHMMQTDPLRVFVNVPQVYATAVAPSQEVDLYREEEPNRHFTGRVVRTANALDPNTRTLLTQIDVPNPNDALRPGMYLQVTFVAVRATPPVLVPGAAILWRPEGTLVLVLDASNKVRYCKVQTGRDLGAEVEVVAGLDGTETVIVHPGDLLPEGLEVQPVTASNSSDGKTGAN